MYQLFAEYPRQDVCRKRQYAGLLRWAAYIDALGMPGTKPDEQWVKSWITAGRVTINPDTYVNQTISAMVANPNIQANIRKHMSAWNDDATELTLDTDVDGAIGTILPKFAAATVGDAEVKQWYIDHGFEEAPVVTGPAGGQAYYPPGVQPIPPQ